MGIRLVYGLKTTDASYLEEFFPSRRLMEAARLAGLGDAWSMTVFAPGSDIQACAEEACGHAALLRGELPMELYRAMEARGIRTINRPEATELARDKLACAGLFARLGLSHPRTVELEPGAVEPPMGYPFVAKPRYGKMGRGVRLVKNREQFFALAGVGGLLAQEYVEASHGRDLRFFFAAWPGGQDYLCVTRESPGWLSNAHQGGRMRPYDPPSDLTAAARKAFAGSGLDYGTVDFLFADTRGEAFTLCELNACPGFEELERATGCDAAMAILQRALPLLGQAL